MENHIPHAPPLLDHSSLPSGHTLSAEGKPHAHVWMNLLSTHMYFQVHTHKQKHSRYAHRQTDRQTDTCTHIPTQGDIPPTSKQTQSRHFEEHA